MAHWYRYAVLRVTPDKMRGEIVNVGVIVISPNGDLDIVLPERHKKAVALDASLEQPVIQEMANQICKLADFDSNPAKKEKLIEMACSDILRCSAFAEFKVDRPENYHRRIDDLLQLLVNPVTRKRQAKTQRIATKVKSIFEDHEILGSIDDIDNHLVVPNYPIDALRGLKADFALKNGCMHITQTIDMNTSDHAQKHAQAALDAVTLDKALNIFGDDTRRYVVYSATRKNQTVDQTLKLLGDHADNMFNLESADDTNAYVELIQAAIATSTQADTDSQQYHG